MRYEGTVYRPPSEAGSLIIQLTIGCARNTCTFCDMYKDKSFRIRPLEEVVEDLEMARNYYNRVQIRRIFLAGGDALIVKTVYFGKMSCLFSRGGTYFCIWCTKRYIGQNTRRIASAQSRRLRYGIYGVGKWR